MAPTAGRPAVSARYTLYVVDTPYMRIASRSGSDRSGTPALERPSATRSTSHFSFVISPLASTFTHPLDSTTSARQTANKSLSVPLSQPPAFPFSLDLFFSFSCTLSNYPHLLAPPARL